MAINPYDHNTENLNEIITAGWYTCHLRSWTVARSLVENMQTWCRETFGYIYGNRDSFSLEKTGNWYYTHMMGFDYFFIKHEESLSLFLLKYGEIIESNYKLKEV